MSAAASGPPLRGDGRSAVPALSADGRVIAFQSTASDLVAGLRDFNEAADTFTWDVATHVTGIVSRRADPSLTPDLESTARAVSADGRWIAFESRAAQLIAGQADIPGTRDVFLHDAATRRTILVSHVPGSLATGRQQRVVGAGGERDGRFVAFTSTATNLTAEPIVGPDVFSHVHVFLFDRVTGAVALVDRAAAAARSGNGPGRSESLSPDGRYLAFTSSATDLVPRQGDANGADDVFLFDRVAGTTTLVSRSITRPRETGDRGRPGPPSPRTAATWRSTASPRTWCRGRPTPRTGPTPTCSSTTG